MSSDNPYVGLNRMRFVADPNQDPQVSIDGQLQLFLQMILDNGNTIISVQQTSEYRETGGSRVGALLWQEFLIISEV